MNYVLLGVILVVAYGRLQSDRGNPNRSEGMSSTSATVEAWREPRPGTSVMLYRYSVAGKSYQGDLRTTPSVETAFPVGKTFPIVYVDARPEQSFTQSATPRRSASPSAKESSDLLMLRIGWWGMGINTAYLLYKGWRYGFNRAKTWFW